MDQIQRFLFDQTNVRGELALLNDSYQEVLVRHSYPPVVGRQLGEMLAAVALLTATVKLDGVLSLEVRGTGPVSLLMAESNPGAEEQAQQLRAIARIDEQAPLPDDGATLSEMIGDGHIVMTLDPKDGQRYQGIVALEADTLAGCLEAYFERSEQLPTKLWLASSETRAGGLLLQKLPDDAHNLDPDAWDRLTMLAATLRDDELLTLAPQEVLYRLFHEETARVFEPAALAFGCTCSRARFAQALHRLGAQELREIVAEQGEVDTQCHFCNTRYEFTAAEVEGLIEAPDAPAPTLH